MPLRRLLVATLAALTAMACLASGASANTGTTRWNTMCGSSSGSVSLYRTSTGAVHAESHLVCPYAGALLHFVVKRDAWSSTAPT